MCRSKFRGFYRGACFTVLNRRAPSYKAPKVEIKDEVAFYAIRIAKAGYYGGNPAKVKQAPLSEVLQILNYENFIIDYEQAAKELNNEGW